MKSDTKRRGNLKFSPGETSVTQDLFSPNPVLFWLKTELAVTTRRLVEREPNTLFNIVPLGFKDRAFPLNNIASVGAEVKFSLRGFLAGVIFTILGLALLGKNPVIGLVLLLLIGIPQLVTCFPAALIVTNTAGGVNWVRVSIFEKTKLEVFRDAVNERVFADQEQLRHNEVMSAHNLNTLVQNQQLQATQLQNMQHAQSAQHSQNPPSTSAN
jgi:hypothetical protein